MDRSRTLSLWLASFFLMLVTLVLFRNFLSLHTNQVLSVSGEDMTSQFVWWRQFGFDELRQGHLALWNPHLFGGAPFFAGFQSALLYPLNWFFMVLPLPFALNLSIALHVFLAGLFTYLWAHFRGFHPAACWLSAFMFMFGGAYFLHLVPGHLPNLCTMAWIPLIFLAVEGFRENRKLQWILLGMFAFSMQIFAGHIQYVYYTVVTLGFYLAMELRRISKPVHFLLGIAGMGLGAFLLAAAQLLPGLDAAGESIRSQKLSLYILETGSMNPERLWGLLMPKFFNYWDHYWGGGIYWEGAMFVSVSAFALALLGLRFSRNPQKWTWAGIGLLFALIATGFSTPFFAFFCKYFPLFNHFRGVGKLNIFIAFGLIFLAVLGLEEIFKNKTSLKALFKGTLTAGLLFAALGTLSTVLVATGHLRIYKQFSAYAGHITESFWVGAATFGLLSLLAWFGRKHSWALYGFVVMAFLELFTFASQNLPSYDQTQFTQKLSVIPETLQKDPGDYRISAHFNYAMGYHAQDVWGDDPLILQRYALFISKAQNYGAADDILWAAFRDNLPPSLGLLRLRYIFKELPDHFIVSRSGLKETPRAFVTDQWQVMDEAKAFDGAIQPGFNPIQKALLEEAPGLEAQSGKLSAQFKVTDLSTDRIQVDAVVSKPSIFVLADNYSRGWKALPLGATTQTHYQVLPVDGFVRGVPLQTGEHHFVMQYQPFSFVIGAWVSSAAWVLFLVYSLSAFTWKGRA